MAKKLIKQYVDRHFNSLHDVDNIVEQRIANAGGYSKLHQKSIDAIKKYNKADFFEIIDKLYSTERASVRNDLEAILNIEGDLGLIFFKGITNFLLKSGKRDLNELYNSQKAQMDNFRKHLGKRPGFGPYTISQIAHFCKPEIYPLFNTQSQKVIYEIYSNNVTDSIYEFEKASDVLVDDLIKQIKKKLIITDLSDFAKKYRYVLMDDFINYSYGLIS